MRMYELDLLRFLAAFSVMLYHFLYRAVGSGVDRAFLFPEFAGFAKFGYLGVDLFFMISGFVILWSASASNWKEFIISRATRLYPTFWVAVTMTALTTYLFGQWDGVTLRQYLLNLSMVAGYLRADYLDGVYWTLQVELKFYVLVFLLIIFNQIRHIERWCFGWLVLAAFFQLVPACQWLGPLVIDHFAPYFIGGAVLFLIRRDGVSVMRFGMLLGAALLAVSNAGNEATGFLYPVLEVDKIYLTVVIGVMYVVLFIVATGKITFGGMRWAYYLGALTYPLYLVHNKIGKSIFDFVAPYTNNYWALCIAIAAVLLLSQAMVVTVEERMRPAIRRALTRRFGTK